MTTTTNKQAKYLFLSGVVKSKEVELISLQKLDRMRLAGNLNDFLAIVSETVYSDLVPLMKSSILFEKYLTERLFAFEEEMLSLVEDPNLKKVFMVDYDFHNIKLLMLSFFSGLPMPEDGTSPGFLSVELIKNSINEDDYSSLPELIKEAILTSKTVYEKDRDLQKAMISLDKSRYYIKHILADRLRSTFLSDLVKKEIDLLNISFLFRSKILGFDHSMLDTILLEGGYIEKKDFLDLLDSSPDSIADSFKTTDYIDGIQSAVTEFKENQSISHYETYIRNSMLKFSREVSNHIFGFEPLVGLIYSKRYEVYNLKAIYIAKEYKLSDEELSSRLGEAYVS